MFKCKLVENLDDIDFENDDRPYGLDPDYKFIKEKDIVDSDGFTSVYSWYMDSNDHSKFFYDDVEDWEADSKEEAEEWFNSFTGSYDDVSESVCQIKPKLEECDKLEETVDARPNETRMIKIIEDNQVDVAKLCRQLLAWLSDDDISSFMTANNYDLFDRPAQSSGTSDDSDIQPIEDIDDIDLGDLGDFNEPVSDSKNESLELDDDMLLSDAEVESLKKLSSDDSKKDIDESKNSESTNKSSMLEELKNIQVVEPKNVEVTNKDNNPDLSEACAMSVASYDDEF